MSTRRRRADVMRLPVEVIAVEADYSQVGTVADWFTVLTQQITVDGPSRLFAWASVMAFTASFSQSFDWRISITPAGGVADNGRISRHHLNNSLAANVAAPKHKKDVEAGTHTVALQVRANSAATVNVRPVAAVDAEWAWLAVSGSRRR